MEVARNLDRARSAREIPADAIGGFLLIN